MAAVSAMFIKKFEPEEEIQICFARCRCKFVGILHAGSDVQNGVLSLDSGESLEGLFKQYTC